jgi:hypothetical protein
MPPNVDQEAAARALGYADWDDATDYRLSGEEERQRDTLVDVLRKHRETATETTDARVKKLEGHLGSAIRIIETFIDQDFLGEVSGANGARWPLLAEYLTAMKDTLAAGLSPCPECDGAGAQRYMEAVCCQVPLPSGECCSNPVPEELVQMCEVCQGSGKAPD